MREAHTVTRAELVRAIVWARVGAGVGSELGVSKIFGLKCVLKHPESIPEKKFFFSKFSKKMPAAPNWIGGLGVKFLSAIS